MGLDMYINTDDTESDGELIYWRKEPAIHSWFESLADSKNIEYEGDFNCVEVPLLKEDILKYRMDINNHNLDFGATGFFFGSNSRMDQDDLKYWIKERLQECDKMIAAIDNGHNISYNSWW